MFVDSLIALPIYPEWFLRFVIRILLAKKHRTETKNQVILKAVVGSESFEDDLVADNIFSIYDNLVHNLPQGKSNIKSIFIKLTMSPCLEITGEGPVIHEKKKSKTKALIIKKEKTTKPIKEITKKDG